VFVTLSLAVVALAAASSANSTFGFRVVAPAGWQVRISRGTIVGSTARLPTEGRWIAHRLSRSIGRTDLEFVLFEDAAPVADSGNRGIYQWGAPKPFAARDFRPPSLGGSNPGDHRFARRNFTINGRFFDLFVESGSAAVTTAHLDSLNQLVSSLQASRGDFYPGSVPGVMFTNARGWSVLSSRRTALAPETTANAVASTIPYHDELNEFPPHRTLKVLPSDGIVILVQLTASNRDPPIGTPTDQGRPAVKRCGSFEGVPAGVAVCPLAGLRDHQYTLTGWVVYGRAHPTQQMRQRAKTELRRLLLPTWPRWP
jgi:hypothetical protein